MEKAFIGLKIQNLKKKIDFKKNYSHYLVTLPDFSIILTD